MKIRFTALVRGSFLSVGPLRAWLEFAAIGVLMLLILASFGAWLTIGDRQNGTMIVILIVVTLYALRLRLPHGPRWTRIVFEICAGGGLVFLLAMLLYALSIRLVDQAADPTLFSGLPHLSIYVLRLAAIFSPQEPTGDLILLMASLMFSAEMAFAVSRIGIRLLLVWNRLRRQHLIWALTHSQLMLVVVAAVLYGALILPNTLSYIAPRPDDPAATLILLIKTIPFFTALLAFTLIGMAIVLPPAAVISYFVARQTTRRLKALAKAATALRAGNYGVRVEVSGEDEVMQLQTGFNAMAADLEQALRDLQAERDAVALVLRSRRELVASVSHELRTPVAILRGYLESTLNRWDAEPSPDQLPGQLPEQLRAMRHDLEVMDQETASLQRLIDDLFTLSRAEIDRLDLHVQPTDIVPVIRRTLETHAPALWKLGKVEMIADVPEHLPCALVDALRLEQVIHNLLRNAVRHTPPGGLIAITAHQEAQAIVLQVKDTGEGIAPGDLPHIWEPFYRADSARSHDHDHSGAGLGLALVKQLVESMNGSVTVDSAVGQGSCFSIRLPCA